MLLDRGADVNPHYSSNMNTLHKTTIKSQQEDNKEQNVAGESLLESRKKHIYGHPQKPSRVPSVILSQRSDLTNTVESGSNEYSTCVEPIASLNQVKEFLKDPQSYIDQLRYDELVIVADSNVLEGFKIEGEGQHQILKIKNRGSTPLSSLDVALECQQVLCATIQGFQRLQNQRLASDCFNILVRDYERPQVANVVPVSLGMLEYLETNVAAIVETFSTSTSGEDNMPADLSMRLSQTVDSIWSYLRLNIGSVTLS